MINPLPFPCSIHPKRKPSFICLWIFLGLLAVVVAMFLTAWDYETWKGYHPKGTLVEYFFYQGRASK